MIKIDVYSDGSATTSDRPGGWAAVVLIDGVLHKELSGHMESATNNDAELAGAINGLAYVWDVFLGNRETCLGCSVTLISDSEIILSWANGKYRFKQQDKIERYNRLIYLVKQMDVKTQWVRGHSGDPWNERCDKLANKARLGIKEELDTPTNPVDTKIGVKKTGVVSLWYKGQLKLIDFEQAIVENYDREAHGKRGSIIEVRESKDR